jgi:hypothetical protein
MGTDIHSVAQAKINGAWVDVETKFDEGRHYNLFAHLAGVRNGTGFAGIVTGDSVNPIQEARGLPDDFTVDEYDMHGETCMGDHSYGWVTSTEVINHDWNQGYSSGLITIDEYRKWKGGMPECGWCGDAFGNDIVKAESKGEITGETTHVRVKWKKLQQEFQYFIDEVKDMHNKYGEVRIVFGFDS